MGEGGNVPFRIDRDVPHQQRLLLSLLDNIPGMVYRGMPDWSITFVGSEVERLTGFSPGEILGKPMVWRGLIHPDDFRSVQETIRFCVRRRDPILRMEYRIVRKDGECRWINDRRQMIYDEEGRLLCVDGLCLDTRPGRGTTFRIYFPASEAVSAAKEERKEAVALFEAHPEIAIAVLDVVMPRLGGKEAFDAMRRARPDLKALFTSGYSTDRIHESFILLPGIEFLPKPYGPASLARRVREVLDKI